MSRIRAATYNVGNGSRAAVKADLDQLRDAADVLVLQEVADRQPQVTETEGWAVYQPAGSNREHNAITWRRDRFELERSDTKRLTDATFVGRSGAGGDVLGSGWLHHVRLRDGESGQRVHVLGLHMVPSVQGHAATAAGKERRLELFTAAVAGTVERIRRTLPGVVLVGGDWNATPDFPLLRPLERARLTLGYSPKPTFGRRAIDLWYHQQHDAVSVLSHDVLRCSSDHKAVVVTYLINQ